MSDTPEPAAPLAPSSRRRWGKRLGWTLALLLAPFVLIAGFLSTPIGKRVVADQIAAAAPASGLRIKVGRIEGDIFNRAVLRAVELSDPKGVFLTIPEVRLDWRPLTWLWSGLDIREVTTKRGRLTRLPELLPGDPDAPLLPDFDIRIDRFVVQDLVIARGVIIVCRPLACGGHFASKVSGALAQLCALFRWNGQQGWQALGIHPEPHDH